MADAPELHLQQKIHFFHDQCVCTDGVHVFYLQPELMPFPDRCRLFPHRRTHGCDLLISTWLMVVCIWDACISDADATTVRRVWVSLWLRCLLPHQ